MGLYTQIYGLYSYILPPVHIKGPFGSTFITDFAVENLNANQTIKSSSRLFQRNRLPHTLIWQQPRPCFYRGENQLIHEITRVAIN
jgi:hypothetical protein